MPDWVSEHIQRLCVVVTTVVEQGGPESFGALPLTAQFLDAGHAEVVMHLLRYIVRGPGRPRKGGDVLESEYAMSRRVEQDQPVRVIVAVVGGDLIAGAVLETEELPVLPRITRADPATPVTTALYAHGLIAAADRPADRPQRG